MAQEPLDCALQTRIFRKAQLTQDREILEEVGGIDIASLDDPEGVNVTVKLVIALAYLSMLRTNPEATPADARRAKAVGVVGGLAEQVANTTSNGDAKRPPTGRARNGRPRSKTASASNRGK